MLPKERRLNLLAKELVGMYDDFVIHFLFMYTKHKIAACEAKERGFEKGCLLSFNCLMQGKRQNSGQSGLSKTWGLSFIRFLIQSSGMPPRVERQQDGTGWPLCYPVLLALRGDFACSKYLFCIPYDLSA